MLKLHGRRTVLQSAVAISTNRTVLRAAVEMFINRMETAQQSQFQQC